MGVRSNEDRLGVSPHMSLEHQDAPPAQMVEQNEAPTLNFVTPTEYVELPSKGRFYSPDHPLYNQESVEIRHMTAKDEDLLTSQTLIKQGVALDRMVQGLIVDKKIKLQQLLIGDKNAIVLAARKYGYGDAYETRTTCPRCSAVQEYSYDLNTLEPNDFESEWAVWDVELTSENTFLLPLPKTQHTVELKLMTNEDEKRLMEISRRQRKNKLLETNFTTQLKSIIVSVSGVTDKKQINSFVDHLPAIDSKFIRRVYYKIIPTIDFKHSFVCEECGHEDTLEVPFSTDFFWSV